MKKTRKGFQRNVLIVLSLISCVVCSCGSVRKEKKIQAISAEAYFKTMKYCLDHHTEADYGGRSGQIYASKGKFIFNLAKSNITVRQGYAWSIESRLLENYDWSEETGYLSGFSIKDYNGMKQKNKFYPVSIQAQWSPYGSGSGEMSIVLSTENKLEVYISGEGDWSYWASYKLDSPDYILDVLNLAREKIARIKKKEFRPISHVLGAVEGLDESAVVDKFYKEFPYIFDSQKRYADKFGYTFVVSDSKLGLSDRFGKKIISPEYDCIELTADGNHALVVKGGHQGLFTTSGKEILKTEYTSISSLCQESVSGGLGDYGDFVEGMDKDNFLYVTKDGMCGVADKKGVFICEIKYENIVLPVDADTKVLFCLRKNGVDIVDYKSRKVTQVDCDHCIPSMDGYCSINKDGKWGVIDHTGVLVVDTIYDEIPTQSENGLYVLTENGRMDLAVVKDGKYGIIDLKGDVLLPFDYDYIEYRINQKYRRIFKGKIDGFEGKWGACKDGRLIISCTESYQKVTKAIMSNRFYYY